jgi:hypothetical protein
MADWVGLQNNISKALSTISGRIEADRKQQKTLAVALQLARQKMEMEQEVKSQDPIYQYRLSMLKQMQDNELPQITPSSLPTASPITSPTSQATAMPSIKDYVADPNFIMSGKGNMFMENPITKAKRDLENKITEAKALAQFRPSSARLNAKDKRTEAIFSTVENNKVKREMIDQAIKALPRIKSGFIGKMGRTVFSQFDPNNPELGEWQKIKMVLTDAQLLNTAKTKGAISDQEMELFAAAAANNDLGSAPAIKIVMKKLIRFLEAEETAAKKSYKKIYGEDPGDWPELKDYGKSPSFATEEEAIQAESNGYVGPATINGKRVNITGK